MPEPQRAGLDSTHGVFPLSHWPGLGHVSVSGPITGAGEMGCADWLPLGHMFHPAFKLHRRGRRGSVPPPTPGDLTPAHWAPVTQSLCCSSQVPDTSPPQGLCRCCSLRLRPSSGWLCGLFLPSFRSLLRSHLQRLRRKSPPSPAPLTPSDN